ncbi:MAG: 3-methyl-2-oxobutanoate hydroxymethyltransferase [bacterium]
MTATSASAKLSVTDLRRMKRSGDKIVMVTAYDYPTAKAVDAAGVDTILVGDSLGVVVLGYKDTIAVTMADMVHHTAAVVRAKTRALVIADLPFLSYQTDEVSAVRNAGRLVQRGGASAVKLEGGREMAPAVLAIVRAGIPVVGHIGFTPQSILRFGGPRVLGRSAKGAERLVADAIALEDAGAFAIVLECVPTKVAEEITSKVGIPTIGIGAGPQCDGQVLVLHDLVGLFNDFTPRFVKRYGELGDSLTKATAEFAREVREGAFPDANHSYEDEPADPA